MSSDLIDTMFEEDEERYPGSRRKRRNQQSFEFLGEPWRDKYTTKTLHGEEVRFYTIGSFAIALGVAVPTLRSWIRKSYIPVARFRLPSNMIVKGEKVAGRQLYREEYIDAAVEVFHKHKILGAKKIPWSEHAEVPMEILSAWNKIDQQLIS